MATIWTTEEEARHLAARFKGVNQAEFARTFKVPGGASMVSQHIKGRRPMNMDAALAYMNGFGVPLEEISPRLAQQMTKALRELEEAKRQHSPQPEPIPGPPPAPGPTRFADPDDSDWAKLQEILEIEGTPPLARKLEDLRAELAEYRRFAALQRERMEQAQGVGKAKLATKGPGVRGSSVLGDLEDVPDTRGTGKQRGGGQ